MHILPVVILISHFNIFNTHFLSDPKNNPHFLSVPQKENPKLKCPAKKKTFFKRPAKNQFWWVFFAGRLNSAEGSVGFFSCGKPFTNMGCALFRMLVGSFQAYQNH